MRVGRVPEQTGRVGVVVRDQGDCYKVEGVITASRALDRRERSSLHGCTQDGQGAFIQVRHVGLQTVGPDRDAGGDLVGMVAVTSPPAVSTTETLLPSTLAV